MNKKLLVATALFTQLAAGAAYACGDDTKAQWKSPDAGTPPISIRDASAQLKGKGVLVEKSELQSRCGPTTYTVRDAADNQILGEFPGPDKDDGRYIIVRTEQLLGDSKAETKRRMARLDQARKDFRDDVDALEAEFGVTMYDPNALLLTERFPENGSKQRVYVMTEICEIVKTPQGDRPHYSSGQMLVPNGALLNTFEFIPGRTDYSERSIYHKGDALIKLLTDPELRPALDNRAAANASGCADKRYTMGDWADIANHLDMESTGKLIRGAYDRYDRVFNRAANAGKAESAILKNANTITILYTQDGHEGKQSFSGQSQDILRIEQNLARQGIKTDRESGLDSMGQAEKRYNQIPAPLPVAP